MKTHTYTHIYIHTHTHIDVFNYSGHTANDLTWCSVKCAFSRGEFYFIPQFGLQLHKLGYEEIVVMNYQPTLIYHQTSF